MFKHLVTKRKKFKCVFYFNTQTHLFKLSLNGNTTVLANIWVILPANPQITVAST